ncbi:MAG: type 2 lanthipeptide synthetase LanM family protein [Calothrix sp. MO_167.B42]|nr:type 2 lanthipeptide synthetase LanM family protein [Calothrix sp. MO_167.B42]
MKIINSDVSKIVINATFLSEHFNHCCDKKASHQKLDHKLIEKRFHNWCKVVGGENQLKKRLQWEGLDINQVNILLGTADVVENSTLPSWAVTLKELIASSAASSLPIEEEKSTVPLQNALPFADFYFPFILVARRKLKVELSPHVPLELLSKEAYKSLEISLVQKLVTLGTNTLIFEFDKFRETQNYKDKSSSEEGKSRVVYNGFIQNLLQDGGWKFFSQYPVLARLIATAVDSWVESTAEFIQRLQGDLSALELTFSQKESLGKVTHIQTSMSPTYKGGRCVLAITFFSGVKVLYKPKDLAMDVAFNQLLNWCNQQNISLSFKLTKILNRQGYGWVDFIPHQACENEIAVQTFYKRAGMLLSLLYLLGANDCRNKDIIANGEYPILIDSDILMHPVVESSDQPQDWLKDSVISTGFLPSWKGNQASANPKDTSPLGCIYPQPVDSSREWKFINTDWMQLVAKTTILPPGNNVVILEEKTVSPHNYIEEIVVGFQEVYHLLLKNKNSLLRKESYLSIFKNLQSRFIFRPTLTYEAISNHSLSPHYLRDGVDYSIQIDSLSRPLLLAQEKPHIWGILPSEIKALQQLDIPYFTVSCSSDTIDVGSDRSIKHFLTTSSYQRLIAKLQSLDEKDLALQVKLIRDGFYVRFAHLHNKSAVPQIDFSQLSPLTCEELQQEAIEIGNRLVANAISSPNGYDWIVLEHMFNANRHRLQLLGDSLYNGRVGISLFLAALAKLTGKSEFQEVALVALSPLRQSLKKADASRRLLQSGLGVSGLGGIIYGLVKISQFLQEPVLLEDAQQAASLIIPEAIAADRKLDIISGVAGAIVGLLSLYQERGEQGVLNTAIACGNHLVSQRINSTPRAWKTFSKKPLTGFSHGAAGNSFSLLRLYGATADTTYLEVAKEAIEYERSVFDKSACNWPDFRFLEEGNQIYFPHRWCHGSVGIGLARLDSLPILQTEETYSDIEIAVKTTRESGISSKDRDHLCCGILGRTELFVLASQQLAAQEWLKVARQQAAWVVRRAKRNRGYSFWSNLPNFALNPSFFQGTAGVGYQFLRLALPESFPSVLIWQ